MFNPVIHLTGNITRMFPNSSTFHAEINASHHWLSPCDPESDKAATDNGWIVRQRYLNAKKDTDNASEIPHSGRT